MRCVKVLAVATAVLAMSASTALAADGSYVLSTTHSAKGYAPTFTGNGWIGIRVPAAGQGYAGGTVPAQSELAGFYAKPTKPKKISDSPQQRANIPTWSNLAFGDGAWVFGRDGTMPGWRQSIDLHTGVITTTSFWKAPDRHSARVTYSVFTDRADKNLGIVQLTFVPGWSGTAYVTDEIDGSPATLTELASKSADPATHQINDAVKTQKTGIEAALSSVLTTGPNIASTSTEVDDQGRSIGQQISFPVDAGQTYTITKFVGVDDSQDAPDPVSAAQTEALQGAAGGYDAALAANDSAWAALWNGRIDVAGNQTIATDVNASEFYLWSSTRDGVDWSISPAGLSSNGYDGHIFWDAATWMYPSLLAQHPDLAAGMNAYRLQRLPEAEQHATATGYAGARFPWESALDGTEQIPPPVSVNSEGLYEQHITADVALAQWQYYLATGDRGWLQSQGWPVIDGAAQFWASRVVRGAGGAYHIRNVTGPDEENPDVSDEVYTNVAAKTTLQNAIAAAQVIGVPYPSAWVQVARGLVVPVAKVGGRRIHPEFSGYHDQLVKQADVTLLQYPWLYPMAPSVAQNDINFYVPRTDPGGPSMSDAVNSIDSSTLGTPGCSSFVFTQRSYQPFIRDVFHQFSETRTGGAFTFMTGIGGFLQEFLDGYSGLRLQADDVRIAPSMTSQLSGVTLRNVMWQGRTFTVAVGRSTTTLSLSAGAPMPVRTPAGMRTVSVGRSLRIATARPDLKKTADAARCRPATASSSAAGAPALAAVDGSAATDWQPSRLPATLTVPLGATRARRLVIVWGREWPATTKPNVPPAPGPVKTVRASAYTVQVSTDGWRWVTVASLSRVTTRTTDRLTLPAIGAHYVRLRLTAGSQKKVLPMLQELTVTR